MSLPVRLIQRRQRLCRDWDKSDALSLQVVQVIYRRIQKLIVGAGHLPNRNRAGVNRTKFLIPLRPHAGCSRRGNEAEKSILRRSIRLLTSAATVFNSGVGEPFSLPLCWRPCYKTGMAAKLTIGFLGAGKMATALAKGFVRAKLVSPDQIIASDVLETARAAFAKEVGAKTTAWNPEVTKFAQVLVLAVKPDQIATVLGEIRGHFTTKHLLISIAAGVPIAKLEASLGADARIVRVMPNTPALVGASASAFAAGKSALPQDAELAQKLFSAVGVVLQVKESLLNAVTGLSGSGPAYVYQFIEALSDGGVAAGLPRDVATKLAAQTVLGAAKTVLETGQHPGALKDMVTSPGGTTIEGLHELEKGRLRATVMNAVRAATEKSKRLGQG
jgi:pyrroline-5-carboxylate reductase